MPEIERTFRVAELPEGVEDHFSAHIRQAYLTGRDDATELRVRDQDGTFTLTVKKGVGHVRDEVEVPIRAEHFEQLWALAGDERLAKRRYHVPLDGLVAELDVFDGELWPLRLVEVEFDSIEMSQAFDPPPWFGSEVTDDERFRNRWLAADGLGT